MAENNRKILTKDGLKKLEEKLDYYVSVRRNEIADQIAVARGFGDLSENAEYDAAKAEQSRLEGEIIDLENLIRNAIVVDENDISTDKVGVGTTARVYDEDMQEEVSYSIVGANEANPYENMISNESAVGAALMGARVGDRVEVTIPDGVIYLKVLEIKRTEKE